jgi:hypothetical protein
LNNDGKINEADYGLYLLRSEFTGEYYIADYTYEGSQTIYFGNTLALKDLAETLYQVRFIVDNDGNVDAIIPSKVLASLGDDAAMVFDGLKNMTITRLSKYLVVIDTDVLLEGVDFKFTLYLTEIEGGFSTSYSMNFNGKISVMSFNIMKE